MKIRQLITRLQDFDPDLEVKIYNSDSEVWGVFYDEFQDKVFIQHEQ